MGRRPLERDGTQKVSSGNFSGGTTARVKASKTAQFCACQGCLIISIKSNPRLQTFSKGVSAVSNRGDGHDCAPSLAWQVFLSRLLLHASMLHVHNCFSASLDARRPSSHALLLKFHQSTKSKQTCPVTAIHSLSSVAADLYCSWPQPFSRADHKNKKVASSQPELEVRQKGASREASREL